ncbi:MAG: YjbQ family protein [Clostridiales bacterium]|nr:YjbQ family protein [Clostridiales bacterium]
MYRLGLVFLDPAQQDRGCDAALGGHVAIDRGHRPGFARFFEPIGTVYFEVPEEGTSLNTDAHSRSVFFGRSETIAIVDGQVDLGEFGCFYFVDWDQLRARKRTAQVTGMGE